MEHHEPSLHTDKEAARILCSMCSACLRQHQPEPSSRTAGRVPFLFTYIPKLPADVRHALNIPTKRSRGHRDRAPAPKIRLVSPARGRRAGVITPCTSDGTRHCAYAFAPIPEWPRIKMAIKKPQRSRVASLCVGEHAERGVAGPCSRSRPPLSSQSSVFVPLDPDTAPRAMGKPKDLKGDLDS